MKRTLIVAATLVLTAATGTVIAQGMQGMPMPGTPPGAGTMPPGAPTQPGAPLQPGAAPPMAMNDMMRMMMGMMSSMHQGGMLQGGMMQMPMGGAPMVVMIFPGGGQGAPAMRNEGMMAQGGAGMQMMPTPMPGAQMQMPVPPGVNPDYARETMAVMDKMMDGMHIMPTNNPDRDFATMMIPHHQGAIDMANLQLKYGKDAELRALAEKIIQAQQTEIVQLRDRLAKLPQ